MKHVLLIAWCMVSGLTWSQIDTTVTLVSKIDFQPQYELYDGNKVLLMGYTQTIGGPINLPSPTLEFKENDSVALNMWNLSQGPPHTIHLHGLDVDQENDGVPMLSFSVAHDDTGTYVFKAPHPGTYLYHCHETSVVHVQAGMYGMLIVRPEDNDTITWENGYSYHQEKAWLFSDLDTHWHADSVINHPHDPNMIEQHILEYRPQHFLINGLSEQQLVGHEYVDADVGEFVYVRLANMGYYGNEVHFPSSLNALVIASDGRPLPSTVAMNSVTVLPGERYGVLLNPSQLSNDAITVDYFDLNTRIVANTQSIDVQIDGYLALQENALSSIALYPNPATSEVTVNIPKTMVHPMITVQNMLGQTVISTDKLNVDVSQLQPGNYVVVVEDNDQRFQTKLIIH